jgi:hypothetical protein
LLWSCRNDIIFEKKCFFSRVGYLLYYPWRHTWAIL